MKFEIRQVGGVGDGGLALAVAGGDLVPGQIRTELRHVSEAGEIATLTATFHVGTPDLPLTIQPIVTPAPQALAECARLFAALSPANRVRFATMFAEVLATQATPTFVIAEVAALDAQVAAVNQALRRLEDDAAAAQDRAYRKCDLVSDYHHGAAAAAQAVRTRLVEAGGPWA